MRICLSLSVLMLLVDPASALNQGGGNQYDPAGSVNTLCDCDGTNGNCAPDTCTISCDTGFLDCDGRLDNGCESTDTDTKSCGSCANNCNACRTNASCNAGACIGKPRPDGTACRAMGCEMVGTCMGGSCMCPSAGVDMARAPLPIAGPPDMMPPGGFDLPGDCSFTGGGTATASMLLLVGAFLLLFRRRRS